MSRFGLPSFLSLSLCLLAVPVPVGAETASERLAESAVVLKEMLDAPDQGVLEDLLSEAHCVVIVPGLKKGAFLVGAKYGRGFTVCRDDRLSAWGAPAAVRIEGGSFGFQIGGAETDVVMIVRNRRGMDKLMQSKFTLGGDADVAAGPVGRSGSAQTDLKMTAEILSYSRSRGVFAGVSVQGATLRQDLDENQEMYGQKLSNRKILSEGPKAPAASAALLALLNLHARR